MLWQQINRADVQIPMRYQSGHFQGSKGSSSLRHQRLLLLLWVLAFLIGAIRLLSRLT